MATVHSGHEKTGNGFPIQEQQNAAWPASFEERHSALGHVSPAYMNANCYTDEHPIPTAPTRSEFHHCALPNSAKKVPPPAASDAEVKRPDELIHSDLSGELSVQSLGKP